MNDPNELPENSDGYKYWAFISYNHADKAFADWLHKALESYRVPKHLVGHESRAGKLPQRIFPVFRDREELSASPDLRESIRQSLQRSRYLIVICSPKASDSVWVAEEIASFQSLNRGDRILCVIVSGEPNANHETEECLPEPLRRCGEKTRLAADLRPKRDTRENAKLRLLAEILQVNFDELKRREKRRKLKFALGMAIAFLVLSGLFLGTWQRQEKQKAEAIRLGNIEKFTELGRQELLAGSPQRSLPFLVEAYHQGGTSTGLRFSLAGAVRALDSLVVCFGGPTNGIYSATVSPDGTRLITVSDKSSPCIWNTSKGDLLATLQGTCDPMLRPAFNPDGSIVATAHGNTVELWRTLDGRRQAVLSGHKFDVKTIAFSPDGKRLLSSSVDNTAKVWDVLTGRTLVSLVGHTATVRSAVFNPDGTRILTTSADQTVKVWDSTAGTLLLTISLASEGAVAVPVLVEHNCFSPDGTRILTLTGRQVASVWDAVSGKRLAFVKADKPRFLSVAFSPIGAHALVFSITDRNEIDVRDVETGATLATLAGHSGWVNAIEADEVGSRYVSASWDGTARIWDAVSGKELRTVEGHKGFVVTSADFSRDGTRLITLDNEGYARVWDMTSGQLLSSFQNWSNHEATLAYSRDGTKIITSSANNSVTLWNAITAQRMVTITNSLYPVIAAAISPDCSRIATASGFGAPPQLYDPMVRVWDAKTGQPLASLGPNSNVVRKVTFSWDGTRILTMSGNCNDVKTWDAVSGKCLDSFDAPNLTSVVAVRCDQDSSKMRIATYGQSVSESPSEGTEGILKIWNNKSKQVQQSITAPHSIFVKVIFNQDASRVLTENADGTITIWDVYTGKSLITLDAKVSFSGITVWNPTGSLILTSEGNVANDTARIWDAATGRALRTLEGHTGRITFAAFSGDGSRLATADVDGAIKIWDTHLESRSPNEIMRLLQERDSWQLVKGQLVASTNSIH